MLARLGRSRQVGRVINSPFTGIGSSKIRSSFQFRPRNYNSTAQQVLDTVLYLPHELFHTVHHSLGFSWAATLPICALLVRACVYFPLFGIPSQKLSQRSIEALPLKQGWTYASQISVKKGLRPDEPRNVKELRRLANRLAKRRHLVLNKDLNLGLRRSLRPLLQFPIFYVLAETIRRMAGARSSLLGLVVQQLSVGTKGSGGIESTVEPGASYDAYLEPSMASEGMLWFQNLTVADPTHNLSFIISATTFGHLWWTTRNAASLQSKAIRVVLLSAAVLIAPLTLSLPSGVLLFWLSSTIGAILQGIALHRLYPLPKPITKCLRLSSLKQKSLQHLTK